MSGVKPKIHVDDGARPIYCEARPVPYLLKDQIDLELNRLVKEGTLEPVDFSEWAAPIVPIVKEDKTIRICGDYKVTVNKVSKLDNYPIPKLGSVIMLLEHMNEMPVNVVAIRDWTRQDPTLTKVLSYVQNGWPTTCTEERIKPSSDVEMGYPWRKVVFYGKTE